MGKFISLTGLSEFLTKCRALFYTKPNSGIPASDLAEGVIPETITAEDLGEEVEAINLGPNVQYVEQTLTPEQKSQARENIGAGTSDFTGDYEDLENKPNIPDVTGKEDKVNKVTEISSESTDTQYPSAKAVHTSLGNFYTKDEIDEMMVSLKFPAEYQRVEYIQGDGTAYIDLGVNNKTTFGVRVKADNIASNSRGFHCGASTGNLSGMGVQIGRQTVKYDAARDANSVNLPSNNAADNKYVQANFNGSGKGFVEGLEDSTTISALNSYAFANTSYPFIIFGYNDYQGTKRGVNESNGVKLVHFQLTDGNALVFDLYPCYRKLDSEPGLYDIVSGTFFTNVAGTGAFTVGNDI